jgi:hypothetical protein
LSALAFVVESHKASRSEAAGECKSTRLDHTQRARGPKHQGRSVMLERLLTLSPVAFAYRTIAVRLYDLALG